MDTVTSIATLSVNTSLLVWISDIYDLSNWALYASVSIDRYSLSAITVGHWSCEALSSLLIWDLLWEVTLLALTTVSAVSWESDRQLRADWLSNTLVQVIWVSNLSY